MIALSCLFRLNMKNIAYNFSLKWIAFLAITVLFSCKSVQKSQLLAVDNVSKVKVVQPKVPIVVNTKTFTFSAGADNFDGFSKYLKNKKVGIITNQSGLLLDSIHVVDFLISKKVEVMKIFAPEHGFRGTADAGELVVDGKDTKTG